METLEQDAVAFLEVIALESLVERRRSNDVPILRQTVPAEDRLARILFFLSERCGRELAGTRWDPKFVHISSLT